MTAAAPEAPVVAAPAPADDQGRSDPQSGVLADVLVEEISIDGMCGVY